MNEEQNENLSFDWEWQSREAICAMQTFVYCTKMQTFVCICISKMPFDWFVKRRLLLAFCWGWLMAADVVLTKGCRFAMEAHFPGREPSRELNRERRSAAYSCLHLFILKCHLGFCCSYCCCCCCFVFCLSSFHLFQGCIFSNHCT